MKRAAFLILLSSFVLISGLSTAFSQPILRSLQEYNTNYAEEKVHVHFDKPVYSEGETIWFKAYIASQNFPSKISTTFYTELIDATGKLIQRKSFPVFEGTAAGNLDLPAKILQEGVVVKGYTAWQLNFDSAALFSRWLPIAKPTQVKSAAFVKNYNLRFFPEGGELVTGLASVLAFTVTDQRDFPASATGEIKDRNGKLVTRFKTIHDGMGRINFEPAANNTYYAEWKDEAGAMHTTPLPEAISSGVTITATEKPGYLAYILTRTETAQENHKKLHLIAQMHQQLVYRATINMNETPVTSGFLRTDSLTTGIIQFTVFDSEWKPLAERIMFLNKGDHLFETHVNTVSKNLARRGKNVLEIEVPDTLTANLSISVTDAEVDASPGDNIITRLFLTGDLRGYVHNPGYYLSSVNDSVSQHLDLVMLTHGWRKYNWENIAANKMPDIKFLPDNYLTLKGKVLGSTSSRFQSGASLNIILETKDSARHFLSAPISSTGEVVMEGLVFYDTITVFYSFNANNKMNRSASVDFRIAAPAISKTGIDVAWVSKISAIHTPATRQILFAKKREEVLPEWNKKMKTLDEVFVRGKVRNRQQELDKKYTTGPFQGATGRTYNLLDDPSTAGYYNVLDYLEGRAAGLRISRAGGGYSASWRSATPAFFLDEMPIPIDQLAGIPISDIALVKIFPPPFVGSFGAGAGGGIAVYRKKGGDDSGKTGGRGLEKGKVTGYSALKEFYSPDYMEFSPLHEIDDVRSTLYWQPYLLTDKTSRKVRVEFYNNDISDSYRIVIEGMNEAGRVTRVEKIVTR